MILPFQKTRDKSGLKEKKSKERMVIMIRCRIVAITCLYKKKNADILGTFGIGNETKVFEQTW